MRLVLASQSASRRAMLTAAGVPFEAIAAPVDEAAVKAALAPIAPRDLADRLAEMKALKGSALRPDALVLGSDSIAALADGRLLDKPESRAQAGEHLSAMSGTVMQLISAAVIAEAGVPVWRHVATAELAVRPLSPAFIDAYLDAEWPAISGCAGAFRIEGPGVQLFARVSGDHFTILGMPLLPVLDYCRTRGVIAA
ncbi:nucleoside triphosphate pyrophosphatase [Sphingomonas sp.]|uniref:Maf family protein n=1 Tax=Sphingomonas sp. TaxID=28214 RepID=UPI001D8D4D92|nr:nucleoside triphosphate pyrophosphatase [Sphingomonas sp.]MBX9795517.1 Maf family protein [Sphingomonas sp.]